VWLTPHLRDPQPEGERERMLMDSDLAWVNSKSAIDKADAMLTLSSAV